MPDYSKLPILEEDSSDYSHLPILDESPAATESPGLWDYAKDMSASAVSGFNAGALGLLGLGADIGELVTVLANPMEGMKVATNQPGAISLGLDNTVNAFKFAERTPLHYDPKTLPGRVSKTVGEFVPEIALPVGPAKIRALSSLGAGLSTATAREITDNPYAHLAAGLTGGVGAAAMPGVIGRTRHTAAKMLPKMRAARVLQEAAGSPEEVAKARIALRGEIARREAQKRLPIIENEMLDHQLPHEIADNAGIAAQSQNSFRTTAGGNNAIKKAEDARNLAIGEELNRLAPEGASPQKAQSIIEENAAKATTEATKEIESLGKRAQGLLNDIGDDISASDAGEVLSNTVNSMHQQVKNKVSELYNSVSRDARLPKQPIREAAEAASSQYFGAGTPGPTARVKEALSVLEDANPAMRFEELQAYRSYLGKQAGNTNLDPTEAAFFRQAKQSIDDTLDEFAAKGVGFSAEDAAKWKEAQQARRFQGQYFEEGAVGQVTKRRKEPLALSSIPGKFFKSGKNGAAEASTQFKQVFGSYPAPNTPKALKGFLGGQEHAERALRDFIATDLRDSVVDATGKIKPNALHSWLRKNKEALDQFPEIRKQVESVQGATELLERAQQVEKLGRAKYERGLFKQFTGADPEKAIGTALSGSSPTKNLRALMKEVNFDPDALQGLRRGVVDELMKLTNKTKGNLKPELRAAAVRNWLDRNGSALRNSGLFDADQYRRFEKVADQLALRESRGWMGDAASKGQSVSAQAFAAFKNQMSLGSLVSLKMPFRAVYGATKAGKAVIDNSMNQWLLEAALDPRVAAELLKKQTAPRMEFLWGEIAKTAPPGALIGGAGNAPGMNEAEAPEIIPEASATPIGRDKPIPRRVPETTRREPLDGIIKGLATVESSNNPKAVGPYIKGQGTAKGKYQFMDKTGKWYWKKLGLKGKYDPFDEHKAKKMAVAYIQDLKKQFKGSTVLALTAYNAGPATVKRALRDAGMTIETADMKRLRKYLPPQARKYAEKVINAST